MDKGKLKIDNCQLSAANAQLKKGYKQTAVGVIPSDWVIKKIGECLLKNPDYGINAAAVPYNEGLPVYLRITDITEDGKYSKKNIVSVSNISSVSYYLQEGDLVFARTGASVGKTYLFDPKDGILVFAGFLIRIKANDKVLLPNYLKYFTQTKQYWNWIAANSLRTGQPGINGNEYKGLTIPLPPTKAEQTAIATALSDADALISSLEKLIAKKRNIKQGTMQQLLTGKKRLPGFSGKWEVKKLGEIAHIDPENLGSDTSPNYSFRYISLEDVDYGTLKGHTEQVFCIAPSRARRKVRKGDVLVSTVRPNLKSHLLIRDDVVDTVCSTGFSVVRYKPALADPAFIFAHLFAGSLERQIESLLTGSNYPAINSSDVKALRIPCPSLAEQTAIAQVLSDMDAEIDALEKKLEKYKMIKQGMMQNLLTGKIRLV